MSSFENTDRLIVCSTSRAVTSVHVIILVLSLNVSTFADNNNGLISLQLQRLGSLRRVRFRGSVSACRFQQYRYLRGLFYRATWRYDSSCEDTFSVSVRQNYRALGRWPAVVERDASRKVTWTWKDVCMTFSVAGSGRWIFLVGTSEGSCVYSPC